VSVVPFRKPGWRSEAEIARDLERRMEELRLQAESPSIQAPCCSCRWADSFQAAWCHNPLVKGFGGKVHIGSGENDAAKRIPPLCGPEKALWRPKRFHQRHKIALRVAAGIVGLLAYISFLNWLTS
jgi:hypothetical protein